MEVVWKTGNSRQLFRLAGWQEKDEKSEHLKEVDGFSITTIAWQMERWTENFENQFNWPRVVTWETQVATIHPAGCTQKTAIRIV